MKEVNMMFVALNSIKWNELFDSEEELIQCMLKCKVDGFPYQKVMGYEYIDGMQKSYKKYGSISPKQLTQLKRLAKAVYKHLKTRK